MVRDEVLHLYLLYLVLVTATSVTCIASPTHGRGSLGESASSDSNSNQGFINPNNVDPHHILTSPAHSGQVDHLYRGYNPLYADPSPSTMESNHLDGGWSTAVLDRARSVWEVTSLQDRQCTCHPTFCEASGLEEAFSRWASTSRGSSSVGDTFAHSPGMYKWKELFSESDCVMLCESQFAAYESQVVHPVVLNAFVDSLQRLSEMCEKSQGGLDDYKVLRRCIKEQYVHLFDQFGTHYPTKVTFGARQQTWFGWDEASLTYRYESEVDFLQVAEWTWGGPYGTFKGEDGYNALLSGGIVEVEACGNGEFINACSYEGIEQEPPSPQDPMAIIKIEVAPISDLLPHGMRETVEGLLYEYLSESD